jgi:hypothetical protein
VYTGHFSQKSLVKNGAQLGFAELWGDFLVLFCFLSSFIFKKNLTEFSQ